MDKQTDEPAAYSQELPESREEKDRAMPGFEHDIAAEQKGPDPRDETTPYGGSTFNGTDDSSRFSTPPAKKG
jgi:hypothetical protein